MVDTIGGAAHKCEWRQTVEYDEAYSEANNWHDLEFDLAVPYNKGAFFNITKVKEIYIQVFSVSGNTIFWVDDLRFNKLAELDGQYLRFNTDNIDGKTKDTDYTIDYKLGRIKPIVGGSLVSGNSYEINYTYDIGGTVILSDGTYNVSSLVNLKRNNFTISSSKAVVKLADGQDHGIFMLGDTGEDCYGIEIKNLILDGKGQTYGPLISIIQTKGTLHDLVIENLVINNAYCFNFSGDGTYSSARVENFRMENCSFTGGRGVTVGGEKIKIIGCNIANAGYFGANDDALRLWSASKVVVDNCVLEHGHHNLMIMGDSSHVAISNVISISPDVEHIIPEWNEAIEHGFGAPYPRHISITNCVCSGAGQGGIWAFDAKHVTIDNCVIKDGGGFMINYAEDVLISNCSGMVCTSTADASDIAISNCQFGYQGSLGGNDIRVSNTEFGGKSGSPISLYLDTGATNLDFSNCHFRGYIYIYENCDNISFDHCRWHDFAVADCPRSIRMPNAITNFYITNSFLKAGTQGFFYGDTSLATIRYNKGYITENWGSSTGTGSQQTIAHGLSATPTVVNISGDTTNVNGFQSAAADATNIYITADTGEAYHWEAKVR